MRVRVDRDHGEGEAKESVVLPLWMMMMAE